MQEAVTISTVANAIQLSVAPVFLLTGIGATLAVMANRLARIVDRFRVISVPGAVDQAQINQEMDTLLRRSRWVHWAISLSTVSALLVCIVIAALFVGSELRLDSSRVVSMLFITAMLALISGLLCFLREIHLSKRTIEKPEN
jgi:predicted esterase